MPWFEVRTSQVSFDIYVVEAEDAEAAQVQYEQGRRVDHGAHCANVTSSIRITEKQLKDHWGCVDLDEEEWT